MGPRPGAHGFGSFCRNKRTSPCGAETPQESPSCCHPRRSSSTPVPDVCNRGSKSRIQSLSLCFRSRAIPGQSQGHASWRHLPAPAGVAAPRSRNPVGGEDCLSEASSAALTFGTGAKAPEGSRPGANGFGSFCRNKRTSACGAETPQDPLPLSFPTRSGIRRAYVCNGSITVRKENR